MTTRTYELSSGEIVDIDDAGYFVSPVNVTIPLSELLAVAGSNGLEGVLDLISISLTGCDLLSDFNYTLVGSVNESVILAVTGSVEMILDFYSEDTC